MLFNSQANPGTGVEIEQIVINLNHLDYDRFLNAWKRTVAAFDALRAGFGMSDTGDFFVQIHSKVALPTVRLDWTRKSVNEQQALYDALLASDRKTDFHLNTAPLMRITVMELGADQWRVLWTFHHAILDGRSFPLVLQALFNDYDGVRSVAAPATSFGQFLNWRANLDTQHSAGFWHELLHDASAPDLQMAPPGANATDAEVIGIETTFSQSDSDEVRAFAESNNVTVHTLFQTAWALLLHHYSGSADLLFGSTRACRYDSVEGAQDVVGLLINTVPFRIQLDAGESLHHLLQRVRALHVAIRQHEHAGLPEIKRWSGQDNGGGDWLNSLVVFENYLLDSRMKQQLSDTADRHFLYRGQTSFPLTLLGYNDTSIIARLEYNTRLYSHAAAAQVFQHFQNLLLGLTKAQNECPLTIPFLTEKELQQIQAWNATEVTLDNQALCLPKLLEAGFARNPDAIAVVYEDRNISFRDFDRQINQFARYLDHLELDANPIIAVCMPRCAEMVLALHAIVRAGGAYLPLDPEFPDDRLALLLEESSSGTIVTLSGFAERFKRSSARVIELDRIAAELQTLSDQPLELTPDPSDLAYVIYTSGSTGRPKGVMNEHAGICNRLLWMQKQFALVPDDRVLQKTPYTFDVSVWEFFWPFMAGACLVVARPDGHKDPDYIARTINKHSVTTIHFVPSMLDLFLETPRAAHCKTLKRVICSGEALMTATQDQFFARVGCELHNLYGPTEAAIDVTHWECRKDSPLSFVPIGFAIDNTTIHILNDQGQRVPPGVGGELHIGGIQVARGYLNRPDLTEERFVPDPFAGGVQARLYKTGDLARHLENGAVEYLGRNDFQVKINGLRIELGEIESVLAGHASVKQCVVSAHAGPSNQTLLVAYVVASDSHSIDQESLSTHLASKLPAYMVPKHYVVLDTMPLSTAGKADRKALPAPSFTKSQGESTEPPSGPTESQLASLWQSMLGVSKVGRDDNFYALGGDSIIAIRVIAKANEAGLPCKLADLLNYPTVRGLAARCERSSAVQSWAEDTGQVPLSPIMHWFFEQELQQPDYWTQTYYFEARGIDTQALEAALHQVVLRHPALRMKFPQDNAASALYDNSVNLLVAQHSLPLNNSPQCLTRMRELATQAQASLDIQSGRLVNAWLVEDPSGARSILGLAIHHLAVDGLSWPVILGELEQFLKAGPAGEPPRRLTARPPSIETWSRFLKDWSASPEAQARAGEWNQKLSGPLAPWPRPRDSAPDLVRDEVIATGELSASALDRVMLAARKSGLTLYELQLAALFQACFEQLGLTSLQLDLEGHGREELEGAPDVSGSIGWFTTIFPLRLAQTDDSAALLVQLKENLRGLPHNGLSYGVCRYLNEQLVPHKPSHILFNYMGRTESLFDGLGQLRRSTYETGNWHGPDCRRRYDFEIITERRSESLRIHWHYNSFRWSGSEVQELLDLWTHRLTALAEICLANPDAVLAPVDFPLFHLSQSQLAALTTRYGVPQALAPLTSLQHLFYAASQGPVDVGVDQFSFHIEGELDLTRYKKAWQAVMASHAALRTRYPLVQDSDLPCQFVGIEAEITFEEIDESSTGVKETGRHAKSLINIADGPLNVVSVIRETSRSWWVIWTHHHLQIDGWSWPLVLTEVNDRYARRDFAPQQKADGYLSYLHWVNQLDEADSQAYWKTHLLGLRTPTPVPGQQQTALATLDHFETILTLDREITANYQETVKSLGLSFGTLLNFTWALILAAANKALDVTFGAAFSGRPADLPGVDEAVGPFVNNLPVRTQFDQTASLKVGLTAMQDTMHTHLLRQYTGADAIQRSSGLPASVRLYESLVVFQNYARSSRLFDLGDNTRIVSQSTPVQANFPLTIVIEPGEETVIKLLAKSASFEHDSVEALGAAWQFALAHVCENLEAECGSVIQQLESRLPAGAIALPGREQTGSPAGPRTEMEHRLAKVWTAVLGTANPDIERNVFELGVQSLAIIELAAAISRELGKPFPIVSLFETPSIKDLARRLEGGTRGSGRLDQVSSRAKKARQARAARAKARRGRTNV